MTIYRIDDIHKVEVEGREDGGFDATFYERMGGRWVKLDKESWFSLDDLKWEYGID